MGQRGSLKWNQEIFKLNENEFKTNQSLWDGTSTVLRGKFIEPNASYIRKEKKNKHSSLII